MEEASKLITRVRKLALEVASHIKTRLKYLIGHAVFHAVKTFKRRNTTLIYAGPIMGDALYSMSFIGAYKHAHPERRILVCTSPALLPIVSTFADMDRLVVLRPKILRVLFWQIWHSDPGLHRCAVESGLLNGFAFRAANPGINEIELLRDKIYRVGPGAPLSYHRVAPERVRCIPDFYSRYERIIVINPYSTTCRFPNGYGAVLENMARLLCGGGERV